MLKKFLFTILSLIIVLTGTAYAGEIKFAQVTDAHFTVNSKYTAEVLKAAVKDINSQNNLSFVVFTGDNIDSSNQENLDAFLKIINKLNIPYYIAIGNHDVFKINGISKKQYIEIIKSHNWLYRPSKPNYVFKKGEFVFIVLDGAKETIPGPGGYYRPVTLDWLDKKLTKYKKKKVVLFQHFPILSPTKDKTHSTYQADKFFEVLNKHDNVIAVISGHYHTNFEKMENGIYHINSPSLVGVPNPYKIIDIVTTKGFSPMIYTQLRELDFHY